MARGCLYARRNKDGSRTWYLKYRTGDGTQVKRAAGRSRKEAEPGAHDCSRGRRPRRAANARASPRQPTLGSCKRPLIEPATFHDYEIHLRKRLVPAFGHLKLREVTRGRIQDYLAALDASGRLSRKTINDSLIPLRQSWAGRSAMASSRATRRRTPTATRRLPSPTSRRRCST